MANRLCYCSTIILVLVLMNATIFISIFVNNSALFLLLSLLQTRLPFLRLDKRQVYHGKYSLRTLLPTSVKLVISPFEVPARLLCKWVVYELNHFRQCHLWIQSTKSSVVLVNYSCLAADFPQKTLLLDLVTTKADSSRRLSWSSSSSLPNLLGWSTLNREWVFLSQPEHHNQGSVLAPQQLFLGFPLYSSSDWSFIMSKFAIRSWYSKCFTYSKSCIQYIPKTIQSGSYLHQNLSNSFFQMC